MFSVVTPQELCCTWCPRSTVYPAAQVPEPGAGLGSSSSNPRVYMAWLYKLDWFPFEKPKLSLWLTETFRYCCLSKSSASASLPCSLSLDPHWQQLLHIGAGGSQLLVSNLHVTLEPFPCACFCCHREMCPAVVAKCHCSLWVRGTLMAYLNQIYTPPPASQN